MKTTSSGVEYTDAEVALIEKVSKAIRNATPLARLEFASKREEYLQVLAIAALKASGQLIEECRICGFNSFNRFEGDCCTGGMPTFENLI